MFDGQTEIHQLKIMHIATSAFRSHKNDKYSDIRPDIHYSGHCYNSLIFYQIHQIVPTKVHANLFIGLTIL